MHHPTLMPEPGDRILAKKEDGWPTTIGGTRLAAGSNEVLIIELHGRTNHHTYNDEFEASWSIGRQEVHEPVHIDFISEVIGHADTLVYTRNTEGLAE